ncbi:hypothetical protein ESZ53_07725 [Salinibacterium sp. UTAS2018]|uniref:hypothetical protein n=1 Tax=Salinibacterium sp. UTAS2018 TaxID=2508880 RepID=UPI001009831C|nr:hypothetical protein [Salinibacterium sp. UTAS2018]QAV70341.1 hypothetical protein ESZ53_07725 [Salinibacterium sp. UTAS2018]
MSTTSPATAASRSDRYGFFVVIAFGLAAAVVLLVLLIQRMIEIVPNVEVPVVAPFAREMASLPIGPDGAEVLVDVDSAIILVTGMPPITLISLMLADAIPALATITMIVLGCFMVRNLLTGRVFSAHNLRLLNGFFAAAITGWALGLLFRTMGTNGAFATLSDYSYNNVLAVFAPAPWLAILGLSVLVYFFQVGARLQRETDGLV